MESPYDQSITTKGQLWIGLVAVSRLQVGMRHHRPSNTYLYGLMSRSETDSHETPKFESVMLRNIEPWTALLG